MDITVILHCLLIVAARIVDVTLGTVRTICVVNGRRGLACVLGFCEVLVWILVVSRVISSLSNPVYAVAYALGFALGNYIGITIDRHLAFGEQVVRVFTRRGAFLAEALRTSGFVVTQISGQGRDGPVELLFIQVPRKLAQAAGDQARLHDPDCFIVVDDVRWASASMGGYRMNDWRAAGHRK